MPSQEPTLAIQRLQHVDRVLGWLSCAFLQPWRGWRKLRRRPEPGSPREVLLIKFWGIGSLQLLTPAVEVLRQRHREARITLLTMGENEAFAAGLGVFDEIRVFDAHSSSWFVLARRILKLVSQLRSAGYDRIYDFEFFTRFSAVVSFLASASRSTGFSSTSTWRGSLHTDDVTFNRYWHVARNFRALAGGETGERVPLTEFVPFQVSAAHEAAARAHLAGAGVQANNYVVLNPNAGRLSLERRWSRASFAALARLIHDRTDLPILLVGSRSEQDYTAGLRALMTDLQPERLLDLSGELSVGELCAVLKGARAVVTNDSGPMHLAAALGAPTLGLFGPETPLMYEPLGSQADHFYRPTVCSPCINVHQGKIASCIHSRPECLENITVSEVWNWVQARVSSSDSSGGFLRALDA